jgi:hypothetical protein
MAKIKEVKLFDKKYQVLTFATNPVLTSVMLAELIGLTENTINGVLNKNRMRFIYSDFYTIKATHESFNYRPVKFRCRIYFLSGFRKLCNFLGDKIDQTRVPVIEEIYFNHDFSRAEAIQPELPLKEEIELAQTQPAKPIPQLTDVAEYLVSVQAELIALRAQVINLTRENWSKQVKLENIARLVQGVIDK